MAIHHNGGTHEGFGGIVQNITHLKVSQIHNHLVKVYEIINKIIRIDCECRLASEAIAVSLFGTVFGIPTR